MHRTQLSTHWNQLQDEARFIWGRLTDHDLGRVHGNADRLIDRVQERYDCDRAIAEDEVELFLSRYSRSMLTGTSSPTPAVHSLRW